MPKNKKQLLRCIKFVAEMRRNAYPNVSSFLKLLQKAELDENLNIICTKRTIMRDIDTLRKDFNAPIDFSSTYNGYFLSNPFWEFHAPIFSDEMISNSMLGVRLAEDIMPSPIKEKIRQAVDEELTSNNSEFFENSFIESLLVASGVKTTVSPTIFEAIFNAWRNSNVVTITYQKPNSEISERDFEPHIIAYHKGNWYTKGVDRTNDKIAVFAIFRIIEVFTKKLTFDINKSLLEQTQKEGLFDYPKIADITVKCDKSIAYYLYEQRKAKNLTITKNEDDSLTVILPPSPEHEAIRWILGEGGKIEVLSPQYLREKIYNLSLITAELNFMT